MSVTIAPSTLDDTWWRLPVLIASAAANSWAEEVVMVAYLLTRLRQLGWSENGSLLAQALLRGGYHLYQGLGGFVGNVVMGLVFGRVWQRTHRLWMLVGAHTLIDVVAFVGYALLAGRVGWLPGRLASPSTAERAATPPICSTIMGHGILDAQGRHRHRGRARDRPRRGPRVRRAGWPPWWWPSSTRTPARRWPNSIAQSGGRAVVVGGDVADYRRGRRPGAERGGRVRRAGRRWSTTPGSHGTGRWPR